VARHRRGYAGERRSAHFSFQLTPTEHDHLERLAEASGMLKSELVRSYLPLGRPGNEPEWRRRNPDTVALVGELNRIGNNVNQLAHRANETGRLGDAAMLAEVMSELKAALRRIL
jgi:Bacterial mobilisation protein (MobC)